MTNDETLGFFGNGEQIYALTGQVEKPSGFYGRQHCTFKAMECPEPQKSDYTLHFMVIAYALQSIHC